MDEFHEAPLADRFRALLAPGCRVEPDLDHARVDTGPEVLMLLGILDDLVRSDLVLDSRPAVESVLGLLERTDGLEAWNVLVRRGPTVLGGVARQAAPEESLWCQILRLLVTIGTRQSLEIWAERFVADRPGSRVAGVTALPLVSRLDDPGALFPRIADALDQPAKRLYVLALANAAHRTGRLRIHPLAERAATLRAILDERVADPRNEGPGRDGEAIECCLALSRLPGPENREALVRALAGPSRRVALEAARALAILGDRRGPEALIDACRSPRTLHAGRRMLEELGLDPLVPEEAKSPELRAISRFAEWVSGPHALGTTPDEIEVLDERTLAWPPSGEPRRVWLLRYVRQDPRGIEPDLARLGVAGPAEWTCAADLGSLPAESVYGLYCFEQLERAGLLSIEDDPEIDARMAPLFDPWPGGHLEGVEVHLCLSDSTGPVPRRIAIASARRGPERGWAVAALDESAWYPESAFPSGCPAAMVLRVHVGRSLLGWPGIGGRLFPRRADSARLPEEIALRYENLLEEVELSLPGHGDRTREAIGALAGNLRRYARALAGSGRVDSEAAALRIACVRLARLADRCLDPSLRAELEDRPYTGIAEAFDDLVLALVSLGSNNEISAWIDRYRPRWRRAHGCRSLGRAADVAGRPEVAEAFYARLLDDSAPGEHAEEIARLARIWAGRGEVERARTLLEDALERARALDPRDRACRQRVRAAAATLQTTLADLVT